MTAHALCTLRCLLVQLNAALDALEASLHTADAALAYDRVVALCMRILDKLELSRPTAL